MNPIPWVAGQVDSELIKNRATERWSLLDRIHKTFISPSSSRNNSLLFIFRVANSIIRLPISADGAASDSHAGSYVAPHQLICL